MPPSVPMGTSAHPEPPCGLLVGASAHRLYQQLCDLLDDLDLLSTTDTLTLALLANELVLYRRLAAEVAQAETSITSNSAGEAVKANPTFTEFDRSSRRVLALLRSLAIPANERAAFFAKLQAAPVTTLEDL